jgi:hypothetical protein
MPALAQISESLHAYGHNEIEAIYTDNISDKTELERVFPPLLKDAIPVEESRKHDLLEIPATCTVLRLSTAFQINSRLNELMECLPEDSKSELHVRFDMKWPVDITTGIQGHVALIQIAYGTTVYLIKVKFNNTMFFTYS